MAAPVDKADEPDVSDLSKERQSVRRASGTSTSRSRSRRSASPSQIPKRAHTIPSVSAPESLTASPQTSREPSPTRTSALKLARVNPPSRSRNGSQDLSPHRPPNTSTSSIPDTPSAASIQRALSAVGTPRLPSPSTSEFPGDVPRPQKPSRIPNTAARLKSPPRTNITTRQAPAVFSPRTSELEPPPTPSIVVNQPTPKSATSFDDIEEEDNMLGSGLRSPIRGVSNGSVLESVEESPEATSELSDILSRTQQQSTSSRPTTIAESERDDALSTSGIISESNSENGGRDSSVLNLPRRNSIKTAPPPPKKQPTTPSTLQSRRSFSQLNNSKNKAPSELSARNMTVETETVSSIPQVTAGGIGERSGIGKADGGSVRLKPSSETMRPKKERKKAVRKAPSITGTASTKADIFEAHVARAVDEANSSDSDETFVYESNPPEPISRAVQRFHSRTPSATSMASQVDHFAARYRSDGHNSVVGKKSMKFANNSHHLNGYSGDGENGSGPPTGGSGRTPTSNGTHHIGRHGRAPAHISILDTESPFPNAAKTPRSAAHRNRRALSPRSTPRSPRILHIPGTGKSFNSSYIESEGADDERTPLISARTPRTRYSRRPPARYEDYCPERQPGLLKRLCGCVLFGTLVSLLIATIVLALVFCSKTLANAHIKDIEMVTASDRELQFDLHFSAINPNLVAIQVSDLDLLVHAKSKYVGTSKQWRDGANLPGREGSDSRNSTAGGQDHEDGKEYKTFDGVDEGTDPIDDPEGTHTMTLGQILHFDSPLNFDASPWNQYPTDSIGGVRLPMPGNRTEEGGSDRWETVIQHPFELLVQGVIKYSVPISGRVRSASVGGRVLVKPDSPIEDDPEGGAGKVTATRGVERRRISRVKIRFTA